MNIFSEPTDSMQANPSPALSPVAKEFQCILEAERIRPNEHPYYHRWADSWVKSGGTGSAEETGRFFEGLLEAGHLYDWQFVQAVRAVRLCACEARKLAWGGTFDWVSLERQSRALVSAPIRGSRGSQDTRQVDSDGAAGMVVVKSGTETPVKVSQNPATDQRQAAFASRWCWRKDLSLYRGLTNTERSGFLILLEWFENYRLRHELAAGREAATRFWESEVNREGHPREPWSRKGLCPTRFLHLLFTRILS